MSVFPRVSGREGSQSRPKVRGNCCTISCFLYSLILPGDVIHGPPIFLSAKVARGQGGGSICKSVNHQRRRRMRTDGITKNIQAVELFEFHFGTVCLISLCSAFLGKSCLILLIRIPGQNLASGSSCTTCNSQRPRAGARLPNEGNGCNQDRPNSSLGANQLRVHSRRPEEFFSPRLDFSF